MKRAHRAAHTALWGVLGPALLALFFFALALRPKDPVAENAPRAVFEERGR